MNCSVLLLGDAEDLSLALLRALGAVKGLQSHLSAPKRGHACKSRYLTSFHRIDETGKQSQIDQLRHIIKQVKADVLLPVTEEAVRFTVQHEDHLQPLLALPPIPKTDTIDTVTDKYRLSCWLRDQKFPVAWFKLLSDLKTTETSKVPYPLLLKPIRDKNSSDRNQNDIKLLKSENQLECYLDSSQIDTDQYILQQHIPGADVDCSLLAKEGKILAYTIQKGFIEKKLQYSTGIELVNNTELYHLVSNIISELNWSGICHLDFRFDRRDHTYKLIDFNARYWTTMLGSVAAGVNFPNLSCRVALGNTFSQPNYQHIRFLMTKTALKRIFNSILSDTFRIRNTGLYYMAQDPLPSLVKNLNYLTST